MRVQYGKCVNEECLYVLFGLVNCGRPNSNKFNTLILKRVKE